MHVPPSKLNKRLTGGLTNLQIFEPGFPAREAPGLSRLREGENEGLMSSVKAYRTCLVVPAKLRIVVHNFARQLFDQLLSDRTVLTAS